jgi:hypothetical protein
MNPFDERMVDATRAAAVLMNRDSYAGSYIDSYKDWSAKASAEKIESGKTQTAAAEASDDPIKDAVIKGQKAQIIDLVQRLLMQTGAGGHSQQAVDSRIEEVGQLYDARSTSAAELMPRPRR